MIISTIFRLLTNLDLPVILILPEFSDNDQYALSNFTTSRETYPRSLLNGMTSDISTSSIVEHWESSFLILLLNWSQTIFSLDHTRREDISQLSPNKSLAHFDEGISWTHETSLLLSPCIVRSEHFPEARWLLLTSSGPLRHLADESIVFRLH